jgi:hypothetical protein
VQTGRLTIKCIPERTNPITIDPVEAIEQYRDSKLEEGKYPNSVIGSLKDFTREEPRRQ